MDASTKRNLQLALILALLVATARTAWIFYERHESSAPEKAAPKERNPDDYVYLRPSHAHDLASAKAAIAGKKVWVRAGNAVAYSIFSPPNHVSKCLPVKSAASECLLPPIAPLDIKNVVMSGDQMMAVFVFASADQLSGPDPTTVSTSSDPAKPNAQMSEPKVKLATSTYAVPIGTVRNGNTTIIMDDIFYYQDPHKLYSHWSKETWAAVERHEITQGMTEAQATAAMGVGRAPESGASGDYGSRTLVFTDPEHPDKPVSVTFQDNAAVSVSK